MSIVIKVGGASLENAAKAVGRILQVTNRPCVIVHGGGVQITRVMDRMKIESQFIDGLRITDERTLQAVAFALLGEVHTSLVSGLEAASVAAVGVFGVIKASKRDGPWGLVGRHIQVDVPVLRTLLASGRTPVIPTLALGKDSILNVNGDETAAAVAVALNAAELVFLTDVEGVKDATGEIFENGPDPALLLKSDFVTGGMLPKLRAVQVALDAGVGQVCVGRTVFASKS